MRCIMVMFDSLNRHLLPPYFDPRPRNGQPACRYGIDVHAPNFKRLAERSATFDTSYVCSMPCMPARRDFHTCRPNFLHTGWGPLEPFDFSVPQALSKAGVYTHLCTDHYHYFEDGGSTYHSRYDSWQFYRGQEGDPHIGQVAEPPVPENINGKGRRQDWVNRQFQRRDHEFPQTRTFDAGLDFIERNHGEDNWFLTVECFDPHEPFCSDKRWRDLYPSDYDGPLFDWPGYTPVDETPDQVGEARRNYLALLSKCDSSLGAVLDTMDRHDMWGDTMLVVWTDHGFLLGDHDCWAKNWPPLYEEVAHTPFFVWDPRHPDAAGQRRSALVQPAIDLGPTLLSYFGVEGSEHATGHDLEPVLADDAPVRDAAIFGYFGSRVNLTDGRYVYLRDPRPRSSSSGEADDPGLFAYTLMPNNMRGFKDADALRSTELHDGFAFTDGMKVLKLDSRARGGTGDAPDPQDLLFDIEADPDQQTNLAGTPAAADAETRLSARMAELITACDAPPEQLERMGLSAVHAR